MATISLNSPDEIEPTEWLKKMAVDRTAKRRY
jgi:hypothetical protein